MDKEAVSIMWKKECVERISVGLQKNLISARGHFEKSQEGVKTSGYVGSTSGVILRNRYSRDMDNIKSGIDLPDGQAQDQC